MGHEFIGVVESIGADVRTVKKGDLSAVQVHRSILRDETPCGGLSALPRPDGNRAPLKV
jgi:threonine dehydrogenase-like Zn-dependent dehydrogenase